MEDPAMTDFRALGTIMGLAGLTAVFGMGTGGAPPVSSPEFGRGGGQVPPVAVVPMSGHSFGKSSTLVAVLISSRDVIPLWDRGSSIEGAWPVDLRPPSSWRRRIGVVKPLGC